MPFICEEIIVFYIFHHGGKYGTRELYGDLRAITGHQKSKFLLYFESSCIVITRSRKLARVITSKSVVKNSVLPTAAIILSIAYPTAPSPPSPRCLTNASLCRIFSWLLRQPSKLNLETNKILNRVSVKLHYLLKSFSAVKMNLLQLNFTTASIWTGEREVGREGVQLPYLGKLDLLFIGSTFHLTI